MLTPAQIKKLREELETAKNPLFFYDGDGDGLASFLLLYRMHREGRGIALRGSQRKEEHMLRKIEELNPDKVFILDVPVLSQDIIDKIKRPVFWIDHHEPLERKHVHYYNPCIKNPHVYIPTSRMCWQVSDRKEDLWIATLGCLADYHLPDFIRKFTKAYPHYLSRKYILPTILFKKPVGELVKFLFFIQKGNSNDIRKSIKILSRIKDPDEIFKQTSGPGKFLWKRFEKINKMYQSLLKDARKCVTRSKLLLFYYTDDSWSFTTNLANELIGLYPKKMVIIARRKSGRVICSLRGENVVVPLQKALEGVLGKGGGHKNACGAVIEEEDWKQFLIQFKEAIKSDARRG